NDATACHSSWLINLHFWTLTNLRSILRTKENEPLINTSKNILRKNPKRAVLSESQKEESSEFLTESEFKDLQQIFSSSLELKKLKTWKNIDNDADILLHNLSKVNFQKLQQMGESMLSEGTQGTLELLRTLLKDEDNNSKIDHLNTDVCYILNLLRF
ncbi:12052_t:CDS:2, partial [Entrophospora sp. SA101]